MKYHRLILLTLFSAFALLSSCHDDEGEPTELLQSKTWKRAMVDKNTATNPQGNVIYDPVAECERDDTFRFGTNGVLTIQQSTNKCTSNEPATKTVSYSYDKTTKKLVIDGITYTMAEESSTQIKYYAVTAPGTGYNAVIFLLE